MHNVLYNVVDGFTDKDQSRQHCVSGMNKQLQLKLKTNKATGPLIDGLRMHRECRERFPRQRGLAIPTCITARAWRTCHDAYRDR